jgi:hypothetical protein
MYSMEFRICGRILYNHFSFSQCSHHGTEHRAQDTTCVILCSVFCFWSKDGYYAYEVCDNMGRVLK